MLHAFNAAAGFDAHAGRIAFVHQHLDDLLGRVVAEQLSEFLFVEGDPVFLDQPDEIAWGVARQCRLAEMRVGRKVVRRSRAGIGEVAAPATGHQDLLADAVGVLDHQHPQTALCGSQCAHQARRAAADDQDVVGVGHALLALGGRLADDRPDVDGDVAAQYLQFAVLDHHVQTHAADHQRHQLLHGCHWNVDHAQVLAAL